MRQSAKVKLLTMLPEQLEEATGLEKNTNSASKEWQLCV
jgi:hypothetical protein